MQESSHSSCTAEANDLAGWLAGASVLTARMYPFRSGLATKPFVRLIIISVP